MVSATPSTDRSSVNGVEVKGVLFKNNAIDMAGNLYFPKDSSESRVDTDLHGGHVYPDPAATRCCAREFYLGGILSNFGKAGSR
jgi:hypothetical protein